MSRAGVVVVVVLSVSGQAAMAASATACRPQAAEVTLVPNLSEDGDVMRYRDLMGKPHRGQGTVPLCSGVRYRIVPAGPGACTIVVPSHGTADAIRSDIARQLRNSPDCPIPKVSVVTEVVDSGKPAVRIVPGGHIDVTARHEVVAVVDKEVTPQTAIPVPDLTGKTVAEARVLLVEQQLSMPVVTENGKILEDDLAASDHIIERQRPAPEMPVLRGDHITVQTKLPCAASPACQLFDPEPPKVPSAEPPPPTVLLGAGALGGIAGTLFLNQIGRRSDDHDEDLEHSTTSVSTVNVDTARARPRPDLPPIAEALS